MSESAYSASGMGALYPRSKGKWLLLQQRGISEPHPLSHLSFSAASSGIGKNNIVTTAKTKEALRTKLLSRGTIRFGLASFRNQNIILKYGSTRGRGGTEAMANAKQGEASGGGEGREGGGGMQAATYHVTLG
jgi:hypothetical protein